VGDIVRFPVERTSRWRERARIVRRLITEDQGSMDAPVEYVQQPGWFGVRLRPDWARARPDDTA
jgi:hypothetical protein